MLCGTAQAAAARRSAGAGAFVVEAGRRLEVLDANGAFIRVLAPNAGKAALSPNRKLVAWETEKGLVVGGVDGSKPRLLVPGGPRCVQRGQHTVCFSPSFVWSPDSTKLLVGTVLRQNVLVVVSVRSDKRRRIVEPHSGTRYTAMGWSAAANEVAYRTGGFAPRLVLASPSGSGRTVIYTAADPHDAPIAAWSPDGQWFAYTTGGYGDPPCGLIDLTSGTTNWVRNSPEPRHKPVWSPDSTRFALGVGSVIAVVGLQGTRVAIFKGISAGLVFAWNASGIYFTDTAASGSLLEIPDGQSSVQTVFTLPAGQAVLWAAPL